MIVQREQKFTNVKCDPKCKNGGVCQNGVCKCGKMFTGDYCEEKIDASGSFSFIMFIFMVALVAAGIGLLYQRDKFRQEIKKIYKNNTDREDTNFASGPPSTKNRGGRY